MPSQRFYNLSTEKKDRILNSVVKELSRVSLDKLSINKIIQTAEISRGSFYQYFNDKYDLVGCLFSEALAELNRVAHESLEENKGDIFCLAIDIYKRVVEFGLDAENRVICQNIFSNMKINCEKTIKDVMNQGSCHYEELISFIDCSNLKLNSREETRELAEMLMAQVKDSLAKVFNSPNSRIENEASLIRKLEIIRTGYERKNENA